MSETSASGQTFPLVTIGMPTFNREWSLPRVLDSLVALDYPKARIRVCFVDNLSTDGTMRIIEEFRSRRGDEYERVVVLTARSNISEARNLAIKEAEGSDYVFFLDSDILAPPDALRKLIDDMRVDPSVGIASLPWDHRNARKRAGWLYRAFASPPGPHFAYKVGNGCNLVSMSAVAKVGLFNANLRVHEDSEFCYRMRKKGFKIVCDFSSEGTHLRDIRVDPGFYLSLMSDSAETYSQLIARGSGLHVAKVASSVELVASLLLLLAYRDLAAGALFLASLAFAAWLNSSAASLDDGVRVRLPYRPVVGVLMTLATVVISGLVLLRLPFKRGR